MCVEMNVDEVAEIATMQESSGSTRLAGCNSARPSCGHKGALTAVKGIPNHSQKEA